MKQLLISIFILTITSCDQNTPEKTSSTNSNAPDLRITDDLDILGKWSMCHTFSNGILTSYNVCPIVSFNFDGTGDVNSSEKFRWTFRKGLLIFIYSPKGSASTFGDGSYTGTFTKRDGYLELLLRDTQNGAEFYLGK